MTQEIATIRIELHGLKPKIWRKVDVALTTDLETLHYIIQAAMGWTNSHMYLFEIGGENYGNYDPDFDDFETDLPAHGTSLKEILARDFNRFLYVYDFGDNWRHDIIIGNIRDGNADTKYPVFVAGEGRCPPEDVGGVWGFKNFLEVIKDPRHPEHSEITECYGDDFDPTVMDEPQIRARLGGLASRKPGRKSGRPGSRKKKSE